MVRQESVRVEENFVNGKGKTYIHEILRKDEFMGHGRLYAKVVLPPGSSIGEHRHVGDTEPYYILKGTGLFTEPDGTKVPVKAGDVCLINCGETHAIENNGTEDLEFMALVLFEEK